MDGCKIVLSGSGEVAKRPAQDRRTCEYRCRGDHEVAALQREARKVDRSRPSPPRHEPGMVQALRRIGLVDEAIRSMTIGPCEGPEQILYDDGPAPASSPVRPLPGCCHRQQRFLDQSHVLVKARAHARRVYLRRERRWPFQRSGLPRFTCRIGRQTRLPVATGECGPNSMSRLAGMHFLQGQVMHGADRPECDDPVPTQPRHAVVEPLLFLTVGTGCIA